MFDKKTLEAYIFTHIPISSSMGVGVEYLSLEEVILSAPISSNVNHKKTVFGGSLQAVATLACWSLLYVNLKELEYPAEIVISESHIKYLLPVTYDFKVCCLRPGFNDWEKFIKTLKKHKKARIQINATIFQDSKLALEYQGTFVALLK